MGEDKAYKEAVETVLESENISINKKAFDKLEAFDDEKLWKLCYDKVVKFIESDDKEKVVKIGDVKSILKERDGKKEGFEKGLEDLKREVRYKFIEMTTGKEKKWGKATELLVDFIKEHFHIYTTKNDTKNECWIYKEGIYKPEGKSEIKKILRGVLEDRYNIWIFNKVINKIEPDTFIEEKEFFKQEHVEEVPVKNGILNVVEQKIRPFDPKEIFFNKLNAEYDPEAECPQIDKFLKEVLKDEEDRAVFYELVGYCLLKEYRFEKAFMFLGDGRNGKDKTMELIKRLLRLDNCASVDLHQLEEDKWGVYRLFGKMANIAGEISGRDLKNASTFKACTGRSIVSGKRKYLSPINFINHAKFIFACNELPRVYEYNRAFWDRWVLFEFPNTFVKKEEYEERKDEENIKLRDEDIIERIVTQEELNGLLNKALEGLKRLLENNDFSKTRGSQEIKEFWIRRADSFMAFCLDKIKEDHEGFITKKELRSKYKNYCKNHKVKGRSDKAIKATLQEEFGVIERQKTTYSESSTMDGHRERVWDGISWK